MEYIIINKLQRRLSQKSSVSVISNGVRNLVSILDPINGLDISPFSRNDDINYFWDNLLGAEAIVFNKFKQPLKQLQK